MPAAKHISVAQVAITWVAVPKNSAAGSRCPVPAMADLDGEKS
jgi:hypothetical protein